MPDTCESIEKNKKISLKPKVPVKKIQKAIRKEFSRSELADLARMNYLSEEVGPRGGARYDCAICSLPYPKQSTEVDHREPVCPIGVDEESMDMNWYVERTFCDVSNLQVLCKVCHHTKSNYENERRRFLRKLKDIKAQLPPKVSLEDVNDLYSDLPSILKKLTGKQIGLMIRYAIRWYKSKEEKWKSLQ